jgi:hypothetical protein
MGERGRPAKPSALTEEKRQALLASIRRGNYRVPSCIVAGVDVCSFNRWLRFGRERPGSEYAVFRQQVLQAEAESEIRAVAKWRRAMPEDWRAVQGFLAAKYPARWGPRIKVTVENELNAALDKLQRGLPPDVLERVLACLTDDSGEAEAGGLEAGEEADASQPH